MWEYLVAILVKLHFIPSEQSLLLGVGAQQITHIRSKINSKLLVKAEPKPLMPIYGGYDSHQCKKCNMICKFLICSMLSCNGCSTGYKIYNQNIRLATLFFISLLPKVCPETE